MSQDVSTHQTVLDQGENSTDSSHWSEPQVNSIAEAGTLPAEYDADSLMDELFEDVTQILERGVQPSIEAAQPEFVSLQSISIPRLILPPMLMPRSQIVLRPDADPGQLETIAQPEPLQEMSASIDRFLVAAACLSAIAAATSWLMFHRLQPQPAPVALVPTAVELQSKANTSFLNYMERSLDVIDRKAANPVASVPPGIANSANLPSVPVNGTSTSSSQPVLERVYIPVYQPPQLPYPSVGVTPIPTSGAAVPPIAAAPAAPVAAAPIATAPSTVVVAPAAAPSVPHMLMGIMQLGDRSAALFEVNSVTQRIYIGESIGTSGWTLVSVSNREAVIRRNGEVRSIYVGQQL
jgi:hypothetical protein